jgi:hypothetical protein
MLVLLPWLASLSLLLVLVLCALVLVLVREMRWQQSTRGMYEQLQWQLYNNATAFTPAGQTHCG